MSEIKSWNCARCKEIVYEYEGYCRRGCYSHPPYTRETIKMKEREPCSKCGQIDREIVYSDGSRYWTHICCPPTIDYKTLYEQEVKKTQEMRGIFIDILEYAVKESKEWKLAKGGAML